MCDDKMGCGTQQGGCGCGANKGCGGWGHRSLIRVILALVVLGIVFCAGVKVGVMKAYFGGGFFHRGYPAMMIGGSNAGYGMMQGWVVSDKEVSSTKK